MVQSGSALDSGSAIYHDITDERWKKSRKNVKSNETITPLHNMFLVQLYQHPQGVNDGEYGVGEFWIDTNSSDGRKWNHLY